MTTEEMSKKLKKKWTKDYWNTYYKAKKIKRNIEDLQNVGETHAIIGDELDGEFRVVTEGDFVFSKYGDNGIITDIDFSVFKTTGNWIDVRVSFFVEKLDGGYTETLRADRLI